MLDRIRKARQEESGFTLIELLIVIVVLGVLAGIVVFSVAGISDKGVASACKADVTTVTVASEAYYAKNGAYAADVAALVTAKFLHSAPSNTQYVVTLAALGAVTSAPACSTL